MILLVSLTLMSDLLQEIKNVKTTKWSVILKKKWPGTIWGKHEWATHRDTTVCLDTLCCSPVNGIKLCPNLAELAPLLGEWLVLRALCPLHLCFGGGSDRLLLAPGPVNSWGQPQPSLMPGTGSPCSPRPLPPLPTIAWEKMETQLPKMCSPIPWAGHYQCWVSQWPMTTKSAAVLGKNRF